MRNRKAVKKYTHKYWNIYVNKYLIERCKELAKQNKISYSTFVEKMLVEVLKFDPIKEEKYYNDKQDKFVFVR